MGSPFPGFDPRLEGPDWADFHATFIVVLRRNLNRLAGPKYLARIDKRTYFQEVDLEAVDDPGRSSIKRPDLTVTEQEPAAETMGPMGEADASVPVMCLLPQDEEIEELYLELLEESTRRVVCAVELLSPSNKRLAGDGRGLYLAKRNAVLQSTAHLVELDFLRGGHRLPMRGDLPSGDGYSIVSRAGDRPRAAVYAWTLQQRLPRIAIPLLEGDCDLSLDLQQVYEETYEEGQFERMLASQQDAESLTPRLTPLQVRWMQGCLDRHTRAVGGE